MSDSVPVARRPTKEECWDQFELVAREFVYGDGALDDQPDDVTPIRRAS